MGCEHSTVGDASVELGRFKPLHVGTYRRRKTCRCLLLDETSELGEGRVCLLCSACPSLAVACAKRFLGTVCPGLWPVVRTLGALCHGVSVSRNKGGCQEVTALLQSRRSLPLGSALPCPSLNLCPCPLILVLIQSVPEAGQELLHCCVPVLLGQPLPCLLRTPKARGVLCPAVLRGLQESCPDANFNL